MQCALACMCASRRQIPVHVLMSLANKYPRIFKTSSALTLTFTQLLSTDATVQRCFTSTETAGTLRDRKPRTATSTFTQLLSFDLDMTSYSSYSSVLLYIRRDYRLGIRYREPRTATSTFTQLLSFDLDMTSYSSYSSVLLYIRRDYRLGIRYREPRTATSTFTQLLSFPLILQSMPPAFL